MVLHVCSFLSEKDSYREDCPSLSFSERAVQTEGIPARGFFTHGQSRAKLAEAAIFSDWTNCAWPSFRAFRVYSIQSH